jgi:hypothetical protein
MTCTGGVCTPTAKRAALNVSDLDGMLASGDTTIKSTSQNPDIEIDAKLSWSSTHLLTLDSYHAIAFNKPVTVLAAGTLTITTNDGGSDGDYRFFGQGHVEFKDTKNGNLSINGHFYYLAKTMKHLTHLRVHGSYIAVAGNIDAKGQTYTGSPIPAFGGVLDGLGNTISNLTVTGPGDVGGTGLVGFLESFIENPVPVVRDLGLISVNISSSAPRDAVGALAGGNTGIIEYSYSTGTVSASGAQSYAGGLSGSNGGNIIGGNIVDSYSSATVSGTDQVAAVGGLVGVTQTYCSPCSGSITHSYASGTVTGGDGVMVGGLVGENLGGWIDNSYAKGPVTGGSNSFVGGFVGGNTNAPSSDTANPTLTNIYSTGVVLGGSGATLGGLIGEDVAASPMITDTYWDLDTSGVSNPSQGAGNVTNDPGITGLADTQLKSGLPSGFDRKVWQQKATVNGGYPYLIDNSPPKN